MIIDWKKYDKVFKTSNVLLWVAIAIYCLTAFIYFLFIVLQNVLMPNESYTGPIIIPVVDTIVFLFNAIIIVALSALFLFKRDMNNTVIIILGLIAIIVPTIISTIFSQVLDYIYWHIIPFGETDIERYWTIQNRLYYVKFLLPYGTLVFNIGITIRTVLRIIDPVYMNAE